MADLIPFKLPTEDICREISNRHHLRFVKSDSNYRSTPSIMISKFTPPKDTHNSTGNGHCTYNSVCYSISGSEVSLRKIKSLAGDEIHENGDKYEFIPNQMLIEIEREARSMDPIDWGGEYQLIALSGKLQIPIYVFNCDLPIPQWVKMQTDRWPEFTPIQVCDYYIIY